MLLELSTPWPVITPKGAAKVYIVESLSIDTPVYYHTFVDATGEPWVFRQSDIRLSPNITEGRLEISGLSCCTDKEIFK